MNGLTLDTGALIALERRRARILRVLRAAATRGLPVTVPVAVVAEWWRGHSPTRATILAGVRVEPMTVAIACRAGEALAAVTGSTVIDAIVMASAAQRGDVVLTGDIGDLTRLATYFATVRVLAA